MSHGSATLTDEQFVESVQAFSQNPLDGPAIGESLLCWLTKIILRGDPCVYRVEQLPEKPSSGDLATCITQTAERIKAGEDKDHPVGADASEVWDTILREHAIERAPVSIGMTILQYAWIQLADLRCKNHQHGRCSHFKSATELTADTEVCPHPSPTPSACPSVGEDDDGEVSRVGHGDDEYSEYEPDMLTLDELREYSDAILAGKLQHPFKPVHGDVSASGICDLTEAALQQIIAEQDSTEAEEFGINLPQDLSDQDRAIMLQQAPSVLVCLLSYLWRELICTREINHENERCSHHGNASGGPRCRVGEPLAMDPRD